MIHYIENFQTDSPIIGNGGDGNIDKAANGTDGEKDRNTVYRTDDPVTGTDTNMDDPTKTLSDGD